MNTPLVSIIVPNYNHEKYLRQRLDSIFNQTFQDFEVILFDDCSTDNSFTVLSQFFNKPKVSHFITNQSNSGSPFVQWVKGIKLAKGEFIWIAETDDFGEPTFLEETVKVLQNNQEVSLVYTDSKIVNNKGELIGYWSDRKNSFFKTVRWSNDHNANGKHEIIDYLLYKVTINNASAVLFRKKQLLEIDLDLLVTFKNVGDLYTYFNVLFKNSISYISQPLNNYREHHLNLTKSNINSGVFYIDALNCYSQIFNKLIDSSLSKPQKNQLSKAFKFIIRRFGFNLIDNGFSKDLEKFITTHSKNKLLPKAVSYAIIFGFRIYKVENTRLKSYIKQTLQNTLN